MGTLYVPHRYHHEELNAMMAARVEADTQEARYWNKELREIDEGLSLIFVPNGGQFPGLTPGYWHIRKRVPGGVDAHLALKGPNGEYRPPGPWMLGALREADMWDERIRGKRKADERRLEEAEQRARRREHEQSEDEARLAVRAAKRMRGDGGLRKRTDLKGRASKPKPKLVLP